MLNFLKKGLIRKGKKIERKKNFLNVEFLEKRVECVQTIAICDTNNNVYDHYLLLIVMLTLSSSYI